MIALRIFLLGVRDIRRWSRRSRRSSSSRSRRSRSSRHRNHSSSSSSRSRSKSRSSLHYFTQKAAAVPSTSSSTISITITTTSNIKAPACNTTTAKPTNIFTCTTFVASLARAVSVSRHRRAPLSLPNRRLCPCRPRPCRPCLRCHRTSRVPQWRAVSQPPMTTTRPMPVQVSGWMPACMFFRKWMFGRIWWPGDYLGEMEVGVEEWSV